MSKIAIIEDDIAIAQMYRIKFESEGYEVETAVNGLVGLDLVQTFVPDIVLLDLMMPEMTGDVMLAKMRDTDWGKSIKVIILTNMGESEAPESLRNLNVSAFVVKANMTPRQVADLVKSTLSYRS
jgi:DNA-binding response OmpR family regulator